VNILIVEDDAPIAQALEAQLPLHGFNVHRAETLAAAREHAEERSFQAMILDLGLPDGDGLDLLQEMRQRQSHLPTIITTARDALNDRVRGLNAGADDYLVKPFEFDELLARLHAVLRRSGVMDQPDRYGGLERRPGDPRFWSGSAALEFSRREHEVFEILWDHRDRLVSKADVLRQIDPAGREIADAAVEVYVHRLRRKIEGTGVSISTLRGFGYLLRAEGENAAN
jgi:two-component system OmpR family response regulator